MERRATISESRDRDGLEPSCSCASFLQRAKVEGSPEWELLSDIVACAMRRSYRNPSLRTSAGAEEYSLTTEELAAALRLKPQTLRKAWSQKGAYLGEVPRKGRNGRLWWSREALKRLRDRPDIVSSDKECRSTQGAPAETPTKNL
jgi:hypothetical protein